MEAKGEAREGWVAQDKDDEEGLVWQLHGMVLYGKLRQFVWRLTARGGG